MVSLRWLKFGGTCLHWHKPSDKSDISLKTETLMTICRSAGRYPFGTVGPKFQCLAIGLSCKERAEISLGALQEPAQGATSELHLTGSSNARSVSAVGKLKRKADDSKHGSESPVTKASRAISDAEKAQKACNDFWQNVTHCTCS
jgi:hypothetical protein